MLTVNEIFHSIQGESTHAGRPCVFVRLTACDLRCRWCDTPYAFHEGRKMSVDDVIADVESRGCDVVEVAPQFDGPSQITSLLAANLMFELLCIVAGSRARRS